MPDRSPRTAASGSAARFVGAVFVALALIVVASVALALTAAQAVRAAPAGFSLALDEPTVARADHTGSVITHADALGVRTLRVNLSWAGVAPPGTGPNNSTAPPGFIARDPADPKYKWSAFDALARSVAASGKELLVTVGGAPSWARHAGSPPSGVTATGFHVNAAAYADFAYAAAQRYSGTFADPLIGGAVLPRIRIWQAWNEPTLPMFLYPATTAHYLPLLNGFYDAVKSVAADNFVIAGGLAPVKSSRPAAYPLRFAAELLCVKRRGKFREQRFRAGGCRAPRARFDAISIHPYSLGAKPGQSASIDGNVFVANVPWLAKMLHVSARAGLTATRDPQLWVTEFAWFTNPPNKSNGENPRRAGLHTAEAIYRLWKADVDTITWHMLFEGNPDGFLIPGGGLIDSAGRAKPTYSALRFPLYVRWIGHRTYVWGRAPVGGASVTFDGRIPPVVAGPDGIFSKTVRGRLDGKLVAAQNGVKSLATAAAR